MKVPESPELTAKEVSFVLEIIKAIFALLNSVGAGVIANYISGNIGKWLGGSAGKKH